MARIFEDYFQMENLCERFESKIKFSCSAGLDRVNVDKFEEHLDTNMNLIIKKAIGGTYTFTKYLELLISKGKNKPPRVISRPTIKDKLMLSIVHSYLQDIYNNEIDNRLIHTKINELSKEITKHSHYVKIDIKGFYSHIQHNILKLKLSDQIPESAVNIIEKAIKTPTVPRDYNGKIIELKDNKQGVPEGLSISNILADIYLLDLDTYFKNNGSIHYCRYVDDILVLCSKNNVEPIKREIQNRLSDLGLSFNDEKVEYGLINDGFCYLGYYFNDCKVGVRNSSVDKFEHSLEKLLSDFSHKKFNLKLLEWKLNLKITGCVCDNRKYGWLFFYSQINDIKLLKHLDWLVEKLLQRFKIEKDHLLIKSFVRTYYEIKYNLHDSEYLISIDKFTIEDKRRIIEDIYQRLAPALDKDVCDLFSRLIRKDLSELERDIQFFS